MILVTGATGTNGVELIRQLSAAGEPARALVRNPEKAEKLLPPDVQIARGDMDDPASLAEAMDGADKVFLLCAVVPNQVELEANVVDAAKAAGVSRLVKFSVLHAGPEARSALLRWHGEGERRVRESGIPFTFLRPNMFMQELLRQAGTIRSQGAFYLPFPETQRLSLVDVRDNAAVAVAALTARGHEGKTYEITGPRAITFAEAAEQLSAATGKTVRYVQVSMEQFRAGFLAAGAPQWMVDVVAELYATFPGHNDVVRDGVAEATGTPARPFDAFARDVASQLA